MTYPYVRNFVPVKSLRVMLLVLVMMSATLFCVNVLKVSAQVEWDVRPIITDTLIRPVGPDGIPGTADDILDIDGDGTPNEVPDDLGPDGIVCTNPATGICDDPMKMVSVGRGGEYTPPGQPKKKADWTFESLVEVRAYCQRNGYDYFYTLKNEGTGDITVFTSCVQDFLKRTGTDFFLQGGPLKPGQTEKHSRIGFAHPVPCTYTLGWNPTTDPGGHRWPGEEVGGIQFPVDKFGLLAPYIAYASTILVATAATAIYVKRVNRRKEKQ